MFFPNHLEYRRRAPHELLTLTAGGSVTINSSALVITISSGMLWDSHVLSGAV